MGELSALDPRRCLACRQANPRWARFCGRCGTALPGDTGEGAGTVDADGAATGAGSPGVANIAFRAPEGAVLCPNCGEITPETTEVCRTCGQPLFDRPRDPSLLRPWATPVAAERTERGPGRFEAPAPPLMVGKEPLPPGYPTEPTRRSPLAERIFRAQFLLLFASLLAFAWWVSRYDVPWRYFSKASGAIRCLEQLDRLDRSTPGVTATAKTEVPSCPMGGVYGEGAAAAGRNGHRCSVHGTAGEIRDRYRVRKNLDTDV